MKVNVLICLPDGTQTFELRDFPESWFAPEPEETAESKTEEL